MAPDQAVIDAIADEQARRAMLRDDLLPGISSNQMCDLAGCTYRQLDYWQRVGLVQPSIHQSRGSGTRRRWAEQDVLLVKVARIAMNEMQFSARAREVVELVRSQQDRGQEIAGWIVTNGREAVLCERLIDLALRLSELGGWGTVLDLTALENA